MYQHTGALTTTQAAREDPMAHHQQYTPVVGLLAIRRQNGEIHFFNPAHIVRLIVHDITNEEHRHVWIKFVTGEEEWLRGEDATKLLRLVMQGAIALEGLDEEYSP